MDDRVDGNEPPCPPGPAWLSTTMLDVSEGDVITIIGLWGVPWWRRLWYWITRTEPKPQQFVVANADATTFSLDTQPSAPEGQPNGDR